MKIVYVNKELVEHGARAIEIETQKLNRQEAERVHQLVVGGNFFLRYELPEPYVYAGRLLCRKDYDIKIEKGGSLYRAEFNKTELPSSLKPLVHYLDTKVYQLYPLAVMQTKFREARL